MIKWSVLGKEITIPNVCTPNNRMTEHTRKVIELKGQIDNSTIMVGDFNMVHR